MTLPPIIPTARLLALLNESLSESDRISRSALHGWLTSDPKWRGCIVHASKRKFWLSTQRLQDCGILPRTGAGAVLSLPASSFVYMPKAAHA